MRFRYSIDFRCGIAVFANFFGGIAVLGTPQCPPPTSYLARHMRGTASELGLNLLFGCWNRVKLKDFFRSLFPVFPEFLKLIFVCKSIPWSLPLLQSVVCVLCTPNKRLKFNLRGGLMR